MIILWPWLHDQPRACNLQQEPPRSNTITIAISDCYDDTARGATDTDPTERSRNTRQEATDPRSMPLCRQPCLVAFCRTTRGSGWATRVLDPGCESAAFPTLHDRYGRLSTWFTTSHLIWDTGCWYPICGARNIPGNTLLAASANVQCFFLCFSYSWTYTLEISLTPRAKYRLNVYHGRFLVRGHTGGTNLAAGGWHPSVEVEGACPIIHCQCCPIKQNAALSAS
jgi:hypothetical protein